MDDQAARAHCGRRGQTAYIDAAQREDAHVQDAIGTGKATGIGKFLSHQLALGWPPLTC